MKREYNINEWKEKSILSRTKVCMKVSFLSRNFKMPLRRKIIDLILIVNATEQLTFPDKP